MVFEQVGVCMGEQVCVGEPIGVCVGDQHSQHVLT